MMRAKETPAWDGIGPLLEKRERIELLGRFASDKIFRSLPTHVMSNAELKDFLDAFDEEIDRVKAEAAQCQPS